VRLVLTADSVFVFPFQSSSDSIETAILQVKLCHIIGSDAKASVDGAGRALLIYEYAPKQRGCFTSGMRTRKVIEFKFSESPMCVLWSKTINAALSAALTVADGSEGEQENPVTATTAPAAVVAGAGAGGGSGANAADSTSPNAVATAARRKFLVFVNPRSGTGHALRVYRTEIEHMFVEAQIDIELFITQRANHAFEHVQSDAFEPARYAVICIVSGDGLIFEVVNGIASRPQGDGLTWLAKIPLAPIPGGTGNGLAKSILFASDEPYSAVNSAFVAIKGTPHPLDLSGVQTTGQVHYSFLSLGWGLISDIDILSEGLRCMGEMRLYLAAVYFIGKKRRYRGKLSMVLTTETGADNGIIASAGRDQGTGTDIEANASSTGGIFNDPATVNFRKVIEGEFLLVWAVQTSHAAATMHSGPGVTLDDGVFTIYVVRAMSRLELLMLLIEVDSGDHVKRKSVEVYKAHSYCLEPEAGKTGIYSLDGEVVEYGPITGKVLPKAARILRI